MIRVAIADDSAFTCRLLASYLESSGECAVVGVAHDAGSTLEMILRAAPDVLTLDLQMPGGRGLELLQTIVDTTPVSVLIVSGVTRHAAAMTLRALQLGAVEFVLKYTPTAPVSPASLRREIIAKVKLAAAVPPVARRRNDCAPIPRAAESPMPPRSKGPDGASPVAVIGASAGGPAALRQLVSQLPDYFTTPCVIVQHLPPLFTSALAWELSRHVRVPVREAQTGDSLEPGRLLITPGGKHVAIGRTGGIELRSVRDADVYRPSIDVAMMSAAESCGGQAVGVVLSGMGSDGVEGLARIREAGGLGYVQDPATSLVSSMPSRAIARAGADYVGSPAAIGSMLAARGRP